jgi:predicted XRE-type DNA-binding protein
VLDAEQVYKLARIGCTQAEIAEVFNVGQATISRNYGLEYARAQGEFKTSLKRAQYLRAVKDKSDTMLVHLGKHWLGQGDKHGPPESTDQPPATDEHGNTREP